MTIMYKKLHIGILHLKEQQHVSLSKFRRYESGSNGKGTTLPASDAPTNAMYPSLGDYMGLELSEAIIAANMPEYSQIAVYQRSTIATPGLYSNMIAPISSQSLGLQKAQVTNGVREVTLCKDKDNKVGLRVKSIDNGIFVCLVIEKSPAALAGVRFGDQILQINGTNVAGYSMDKVHELFRKSPLNGIKVALRDRPFERTITLHKDNSSAAKNGLLINHQLLEVDGQNVVGLKDKEITRIIDNCGDIVTITIIPSYIYEHMVKKMSGSLIKSLMDHSIPEI
ncbi:hypothetical protein Trydic_g17793 [Trypoxylus dichotomus]